MAELAVEGRLIATDLTDAAPAFRRADLGILVPPIGTIEYTPALREICRTHDIGLLIPLIDLDLRCLARHRDTFADDGCQIMIGPPGTILMCRNKVLTSEFLAGIGLPAIRTFTLEDFRARPFFPCFIKPLRGSASIGTGVLHSEAELNAHVATFGDLMLVQDYVPGSEYTLDIYRTRSGQVQCVVPRQRLSVRAGEVQNGVTVHDDELIRAGVRLGEALEGVWGVVNAQCRRPEGGQAHLFEINPRFGGGAPLSIAAGANLPRYVLEERLGLPVSATLGQFTPNLLMLRYDDAVFVEIDDPKRLPGFDAPQVRR